MAAAPERVAVGAAIQNVMQRFGGRVRENESNVSVGVAAAPIVGNNPDRIALIIVNFSPNSVTIGLNASITTSAGIPLAPNGGTALLDVLEDLTLPAREWWGISSAAASPVYILEVSRFNLEEV